jgi:hypothetical protein
MATMCPPVIPFAFTLSFLLFFLPLLPSNSLHTKSLGGAKYHAKHAGAIEKNWKTAVLRTTFQGFLIEIRSEHVQRNFPAHTGLYACVVERCYWGLSSLL